MKVRRPDQWTKKAADSFVVCLDLDGETDPFKAQWSFTENVCFNGFQAEGENEVNNELANRISLFYADATPMLKTLSDSTTKFVSEVGTS